MGIRRRASRDDVKELPVQPPSSSYGEREFISFFMTYGWAILTILIAIVAMMYFIKPQDILSINTDISDNSSDGSDIIVMQNATLNLSQCSYWQEGSDLVVNNYKTGNTYKYINCTEIVTK